MEQILFLEPEGKVMDYLEIIARGTSHIPDNGKVMVRYYLIFANAAAGACVQASAKAIERHFHWI